ncbi:MAG: DUF433 domain-containing protein [Chloroflexi bacterium]|nr:DUF433 domain-containing protein [Chloroflexota bacterium]
MTAMSTTHTGYVSRHKEISNGRPVITGTRIRVSQIALEYERLEWTPDQIVDAHPHLTLAQVHAALSYYYDNLSSFHKEFVENKESLATLRRHYAAKMALAHAA